MAANEKHEPVTFGVTIEKPSASPQPQPTQPLLQSPPALRSPPSNESTMSTTSADLAHKEMGVDSSNPYSAFYKHPEARRSMDASSAPQSKVHLDIHTFERDPEAGLPLSAATTQQPKSSVDGRVKECTMWPSRQAVMDQRKTYKRARGCNLFKNLTGKQRLWAKIIIALVVVAAAVGLGVGISRAVGGGVWAGQGRSKEIPHN
ncbi:hypothetical protein HBH56_067870 [Parastagonospora nodorum]|uniref:Uncharacterized protein n=1 Tax=Phaeosphaeria nodorum (strain SN15 / ATCC MYA-4574 / FGSC 10173) TaxID=321614 RepID=Q0UX25_PHANO|nr:hypothetical protein SNOG_03689 [Parastagonospora nodorum SN15]KAH3916027.1 hypothetical protein HBH56_067870 [Parastagonospora nodorum]EAT88894.1 hypothetical protein SNOG_03689 [Parastagonospora nodorum SN15]KAH3932216.1 hypothetical protein HBH54_080240 [Parastagonospora nodorum]KAH3954782.1 hypothetical protein HBH53_014170 [Parastagonospora nodorum]KAH3986521.1 hypothetical protein HBH52_045350 [Parastagonospora nodorum]